MLLLIDNFDSFTHNLGRYFTELGQEVKIVRNNHISCQEIKQLAPEYLVFSPGPKTPDHAGICLEAIDKFAGKIPMLGVCLGHQAIAQVFGATVTQATNIKHGKTSYLQHDHSLLYQHVDDPFVATRYHSLLIEQGSLSSEFKVNAWCKDEKYEQEIMGIEHNSMPLYGVQYHPESILTLSGKQILNNFLQINSTINPSENQLNIVKSKY